MDRIEMLGRLLESRYGTEKAAIHPLSLSEDEQGPSVYSVERATGPMWVLRACPQGYEEENLGAQAAILQFLETQDYPTTRVVPASDGSPVVRVDGWQVMMMTYVKGTPPDYTPHSLSLLGASLGKLHSLDPGGAHGPSLPLARWSPKVKIEEAMRTLQSISAYAPDNMQDQYEAFGPALQQISLSEDLPSVLIHTDCYPGNAVQSSPEEITLLNWTDAGLGPAVIDLGMTLLTCSTALPWAPELEPNVVRINAIVDGYHRRRSLTSQERDSLLDAVRLAPAVMAAENFAAAINGTRGEGQWRLWWSRYKASEGIAEVARTHFERLGRG